VQWTATGSLLVAAGGAAIWAVVGSMPLLVGIDALGLLLMAGVVWGLGPERPRTAVLADLVVGWPLVPALVAWMSV
jgi:4-hydroxybenzoate polyprenyltransferase